jgi:hypothetical protein
MEGGCDDICARAGPTGLGVRVMKDERHSGSVVGSVAGIIIMIIQSGRPSYRTILSGC